MLYIENVNSQTSSKEHLKAQLYHQGVFREFQWHYSDNLGVHLLKG